MTSPDRPDTTVTADEPARFGDAKLAAAFRAFLERHEGEAHIVALQDFPDPDAIAAGLAYRKLAEPFGIRTDIAYEGRVSHQENLALVHILDIELLRFTDGVTLDRYDGAVFIDNQGTTTRLKDRLDEAGVPTLAVIDHHARQQLLEPEFADIRPVGAAATIFADYLHSGEIFELDAENPGHARLATALMHALRSETNGFMRAGPAEYAAGAYLSQFHDAVLVEKILRVQRSRGTMDVIRAALTNRRISGGFSIAGVGYVRHADRDAIPQASDFLLTEENVGAAIVYGLLSGDDDQREVIVGSVRTNRITLDVDGFLKRALGADARGRYYGGGRPGAGGFEIPVGFLEGSSDGEQARMKWEAFDQQIRLKLMRAAGLDEPGDED
ncbi:MAG: bifunctional oligoribonuclease/PAP phosphatase NrnA [Gemmatimonadetes bacterium]|nr:bifunctional oligoribonuclease/PAP phosphatase NrnA [Gemmatimonadota bacterium]